MNRLIKLFCLLWLFAGADGAIAQELDAQQLVGEWKVDLRPSPDAEAYFQKLVIAKVEDQSIEGTFYYDSEIIHSALNLEWGAITMAFVTQDNSGYYNSSARLIDGKLSGTTHSIGRDFVAVWTAEKVN